jgi:DNA-binding NarL/FixJ family response regulator
VNERCLIVDDSSRFLAAARGLLEHQGMAVVGVASTGAQALRLAAELQPDVTLVDLDLAGESGLGVARQLSTLTTPTQVVLISTHSEDDFAGLIAASPAIGFLPKAGLSASAIREMLAESGGPVAGEDGSRPTTA